MYDTYSYYFVSFVQVGVPLADTGRHSVIDCMQQSSLCSRYPVRIGGLPVLLEGHSQRPAGSRNGYRADAISRHSLTRSLLPTHSSSERSRFLVYEKGSP